MLLRGAHMLLIVPHIVRMESLISPYYTLLMWGLGGGIVRIGTCVHVFDTTVHIPLQAPSFSAVVASKKRKRTQSASSEFFNDLVMMTCTASA